MYNDKKDEKPIVPVASDIQPEIPQQQMRFENLFGMFKTTSSTPTDVPKTAQDQIRFYSSGSTYRIYIYDVTNNVWRYATLT